LTGLLRKALSDASRLRAMEAESYWIVGMMPIWKKMAGVFIEGWNRARN
jgi:hypothetical protein